MAGRSCEPASQPASLQSSPLHKQNASPENSPSQSMLAPVPAPREDVPVVVSQPAKQVTIVVHPTVSNDTRGRRIIRTTTTGTGPGPGTGDRRKRCNNFAGGRASGRLRGQAR